MKFESQMNKENNNILELLSIDLGKKKPQKQKNNNQPVPHSICQKKIQMYQRFKSIKTERERKISGFSCNLGIWKIFSPVT